MKYKVGDRVRIKNDLTRSEYSCSNMEKFAGTIMTIWTIHCDETGSFYKMKEDHSEQDRYGWDWYDDMIEGLADPKPKKPTMTEIYRLAIDTYGEDEQCRMIQEEMDELGVALSKFHRDPYDAKRFRDVQEEIADVCIMVQQAKMIFDEKDVDEIIQEKTNRLYDRLKDEQAVEVVSGKHKINGETYTWINPDNATVEVGSIAIAETSKGHMPVIVTHIRKERLKDVKHHKKIVAGGLSDE